MTKDGIEREVAGVKAVATKTEDVEEGVATTTMTEEMEIIVAVTRTTTTIETTNLDKEETETTIEELMIETITRAIVVVA